METRRSLLIGASASLILPGSRAFAGPLPPPPAPAPVGPCKFGSAHTRFPFNGQNGPTSGGSYTICGLFTGETDFDFVRFVYQNNSTTAPMVITSASVAASSSLNDSINPTNASGTASNAQWVPITFNNGGAAGDIPSPLGSTRGVSVPAGMQNTVTSTTSDIAFGWAFSDWIAVQSLARTDGGSLPIIMCRTYGPPGLNCYNVGGLGSPADGSAWDTYAAGRVVRGQAVAGDSATTPGTNSSGIAGYLTPFGVQFLYRKRGLSCLVMGDSIFQGFGTTSTQNDPFQIAAAALSVPSFPITVTKQAFQGMSSLSFMENGQALFNAIYPDVFFIKCESPNDSPTTKSGAFERSFSNALSLADLATRRGCVPVLSTAMPWNYTGTTEISRQTLNAAIRAAGWLYIDFDAALASAPGAATINSSYNSSTQNLHPNDIGNAAVAPYVQQVLAKIKATRPL